MANHLLYTLFMAIYDTYLMIKQAVASDQEILDAAYKYYDNADPEDPKRRWDHVLDDIEVAKKIRGRELTPIETATLAFHDSGYKNPLGYVWGKTNHPMLGAQIFRKEGPQLGFTPEEVKHIAKVIRFHMRKPNKRSPLLKDDLQMLMFGSDEGTPLSPYEDAKKYLFRARAGFYKGISPEDPDFIKKLVAKVKTFHDYSTNPRLAYYRKVYPDYHKELYNYWQSDQLEKDYEKMLNEEKQATYERPYSLEEIKKLYGPDLYNKLKNDPVHSWRANTGIELIHDEPSQEEFDRIVNNWRLMTAANKAKSDEMSRKLFGLTNEEHIKQIEARKFIDEVKKLALKKNLNFFLVTDGASGISNRGNPAVRNAREAQIKWELENGYNPYDDWGRNKPITFPKEEIANLKGKKHFYTTRVSSDYDKYNLGDTVTTPWGDNYVVDSEDIYDDVKKHKFW